MQTPTCNSEKTQAPSSLPHTLRNFHKKLPLEGEHPNAILSLPDDHLLYLIAAIRNTPNPPPTLSLKEWQTLFAQCQPHGILPLIAYHIRTWPEEYQPPKEIRHYLNEIFLSAAARNLRTGRQIQSVTDALKEAGIPVILLKGPALARTVYPDPAIRQSLDIDLLVQPRNLQASEKVLEKLGYVCPAKTQHLSFELHHDVYEPSGKGLRIELHWVTDRAFSMVPEGWLDEAFSRRIPVIAGDLSCDTFSHPDHLLFLAFHHVFLHPSTRLDWIYDISLLMRQLTNPDDGEKLGQISAEHNIRIPMELALTSAKLWTGCELPGGFQEFSSWPPPGERELRLMKHAPQPQRSLYSEVYLLMQGRHGIREKVRCGYRLIIPPPQLLHSYRRSPSRADIPLAHMRRWVRFLKISLR